jgi:hypothetical protein
VTGCCPSNHTTSAAVTADTCANPVSDKAKRQKINNSFLICLFSSSFTLAKIIIIFEFPALEVKKKKWSKGYSLFP